MSGATVVRTLRVEIAELLANAGIEDARREARDLIAAVVDQPRFWPITHAGHMLDGDAVRAAAERRAQGMPFAYAVGKAAFRHLTLVVDQRVLIPRQETEHLIDLVLGATEGRGVVADIGTGSGCIALALATEGDYELVIATDVSQESTAVARTNADLQNDIRGRSVEIRVGAFLDPLTPQDRVTAIVANPPYIAPHEMAESAIQRARLGTASRAVSADRRTGVQRIGSSTRPRRCSWPGGLLALECDSRRAQRVAHYVRQNGAYHDIKVHSDFTGRERYVLAHKR